MYDYKIVDFTTTDELGLVRCYMMICDLPDEVKECFVTKNIAWDYPELNDGRYWMTNLKSVWCKFSDDEQDLEYGVTMTVKPWVPMWLAKWVLNTLYWSTKL